MSKEEYRWYRDHHICVRCHKEDAVPGRVMCPDCMAWSRMYNAKRRAKNRETINRNYMKRIHRRKEQGICYRCNSPAVPGKTMCAKCARKDLERKREKRIAAGCMPAWERKELGICLRCNEKVVPGHGYCEKHLEEYRGYIKKAKAAAMVSPRIQEIRKWMNKAMIMPKRRHIQHGHIKNGNVCQGRP